jgi:hypothetical protein
MPVTGGGGKSGRVLALSVLKQGPDEERPAEAGSNSVS